MAYHIEFSLRNLTKSAKTIDVHGGGGVLSASLGPGQVLEGQTIQAVQGSPLTVTVGGQSLHL